MPSMINPKILVTGATGRTGGAVVTQLLGKAYPVRVQEARSDLLQRRGGRGRARGLSAASRRREP